MTCWRIDLAWRGGAYVGWQRQAEGRSIQGVVEEAAASLLGGEAVVVRAAGRTDAGVHAAHQVAALRTSVERTPREMRDGLNRLLPTDIACLDAFEVPDDFDPRGWTLRKLYRYRLLDRRARCPFRHGFVWHLPGRFDGGAMSAAATALVGVHDFTTFRAAGCAARHPVRRIESLDVRRADDEVHFDFVGNGFLRHQVRIAVGTLVEVGRGRRPPGDVSRALDARDRAQAGETAPPEGLWLMRVEIGDRPSASDGAD